MSDYRRITREARDVAQTLRQGPLRSGDLLVIGHFEDLLRGSSTAPDGQSMQLQTSIPGHDVERIEVRCVALHGTSGRLVGARRSFALERAGERPSIRPETITTEQLRSRRKHKQLKRWIRDASCEASCASGT